MHKLELGDVVDIIVPASGSCTKAEYGRAIEFVKEFGLTPKFRSFADVIRPGLCANTVDYRFQHLMEALESKESKAVWCLNGGYGSQQLLEKLDEIEAPATQKLFIGFSDLTILLNYFADKWGWVGVHGPMPGQIGKVAESTWQSLADVVFGKKTEIRLSAVALNKVAKENRSVQGKFMGGCLSLMQAFLGTSQMPNLEGAVLMLEDDRFETPRRIDRILNQMHRAGVFYDVAAVVLGNLLEGPTSGSKEELELQEVVEDLANKLDEMGIPLIQNNKLGHGQDMLTVLIGAEAEVKLGDKPEVSFVVGS